MAGRSVALALASFRHDTAVLQLLDEVLSGPDAGLFDPILVVDSLGTGRIQAAIADRGWTGRVVYHTADTNLGSAGNLARRLELAAAAGAEWVFAVNQDGEIRADSVRKMAQVGRSLPRIGAVYPLRRKVNKEGRYDFTGKSALPLPFIGEHRAPVEPLVDVHWGSSNGTLYALAPIREGLTPWADLFMGWEDMGYGWELERNGWRQVVVTDAPFDDPQEYASHRIGPFTLRVTDKPAWYAYYQMRNLILVTRRARKPPSARAMVAGRIALEFGLTTFLRPQKPLRLRLLARGVIDGVRGRTGKWRLP